MTDLLVLVPACWIAALVLAIAGRLQAVARGLLAAGAFAFCVFAVLRLPAAGPSISLGAGLGDHAMAFRLDTEALWLGLFGFFVAGVACLLGSPGRSRRGWIGGAALGLLGALGVFGLQDALSFLVAWETMSIGGACVLLSDRLGKRHDGESTLFMLALLETGTVALMAAMLTLAHATGSFDFSAFPASGATLAPWLRFGVGLLLLCGFGAKLGLLPFYEWLPGAYGAGSGASGALLSGVILNAAYFALARGLEQWLPAGFALGTLVIAAAVVSAVLAILYAFQEEDWRELLSFSTAENAAVAVAALGASLLFRSYSLSALAALAWTVALLHLAGHALAKGALLLASDGVYRALGDYRIAQRGLLHRSHWLFGVGVVFAGMSLAAMPPQAGFVSEWFTFQTVFQGFHVPSLAGRLVLAFAGIGLALTAAIAFATFVKVVGIGAQGRADEGGWRIAGVDALASGILGVLVLVLAAGMPWWLRTLDHGVWLRFASHAPARMQDGLMLVPLTAGFSFISPTLLVIVCPILALLPALLLWSAARRHPVRRAPVWYGGLKRESARVATTALTFSNALRVFYSFVYRPTVDVAHEHHQREYFVHRTRFDHAVAPVFGPLLFRPLTRGVLGLAERLRVMQSGHMNVYLAMIGGLLVAALLATVL